MVANASTSKPSLEGPNLNEPRKPFHKLGKLLGIKPTSSTPAGEKSIIGSSTGSLPITPITTAPNSALSRSTSRRTNRKGAKSIDAILPRSLGSASRVRNLNHSVSAPTINDPRPHFDRSPTSITPTSSEYGHVVFPEASISRRGSEPNFYSAGNPGERLDKPKRTWKRRIMFSPRRSDSPSCHDRSHTSSAFSTSLDTVESSPISPQHPHSLTQAAPSHTVDSGLSEIVAPHPVFPQFPKKAGNPSRRPQTATDSIHSDADRPMRHASHRSCGSMKKASRTLGFPEITFATEFGEVPLSANYSYEPFGPAEVSSPKVTQTPVRPRRLSFTFSAIPAFLRPSRGQQSPATPRSRASLSSLDTSDIHKFGLADDLSDNWGEIHEPRTSTSDVQISPITFRPPTPTPLPPSSTDKVKLEASGEVSNPPVTLTCVRSQSYSSLRQPGSTASGSRPLTPFEDRPNLPVRANWLECASHLAREPERRSSPGPSSPSSAQTWSGQWNQDDMQDVIKKLRCLK